MNQLITFFAPCPWWVWLLLAPGLLYWMWPKNREGKKE
jgi:hypothetical protein